MDWIYPISYLISLSGLILWFLTQGTKLSRAMSAIFLFGYLGYITSLAFSSGELSYKLLVLVRDMLVMGAVVAIFNLLRKHTLALMAVTAAAACVVYFSYFNTLDWTFPQLSDHDLYKEGEFLIQVNAENRNVLDDIRKRFPCEISEAFRPAESERTVLDDYFMVNVQTGRTRELKKVYHWLSSASGIIWVEPNEVLDLSLPESKEIMQQSSGTHYSNDPMINQQWAFDLLSIDQLHQALSLGSVQPRKKTRLAIIDTGVDARHEDLQDNYYSINKEYDTDPKGHGTHCAGIAGAVSNNGIGIASLSPARGFIEITSVRALNAQGMGTQQSVISAMIKAIDQGADVLSVSLGGPSTQSRQKAYQDVITYANDHLAIVVVAAGNNQSNAKKQSPANTDGVITVSAIDQNKNKAPFSNTVGDLRMGIAAPGVEIYSTLPQNQYGTLSGTSMATPAVAGLIALMKSFRPDLNAKDAYRILKSTGLSIPGGKHTGPLIQPVGAMEAILD